MKIDHNRGLTPPDTSRVQKTPVREQTTADRPEDRVELSHQPTTEAQDAARAARIEELRIQVRDGTYRAPAEDIARGIVDDMLGGKSA